MSEDTISSFDWHMCRIPRWCTQGGVVISIYLPNTPFSHKWSKSTHLNDRIRVVGSYGRIGFWIGYEWRALAYRSDSSRDYCSSVHDLKPTEDYEFDVQVSTIRFPCKNQILRCTTWCWVRQAWHRSFTEIQMLQNGKRNSVISTVLSTKTINKHLKI